MHYLINYALRGKYPIGKEAPIRKAPITPIPLRKSTLTFIFHCQRFFVNERWILDSRTDNIITYYSKKHLTDVRIFRYTSGLVGGRPRSQCGCVLGTSLMLTKPDRFSLHYDAVLLPLTQKGEVCLIPRDFMRKHFSNDDLSFLQLQDTVPINFARVAARRNLQNEILAAGNLAIDASDIKKMRPSRKYNVKKMRPVCSTQNYNAKETRQPIVCSDPSRKTNLDLLCELAALDADRKSSQ